MFRRNISVHEKALSILSDIVSENIGAGNWSSSSYLE